NDRGEMLDEGRMRAFDQQSQGPSIPAPAGEADRLGRRDLGVALADDLAPAADDRALDEAEPPERLPASLGHELTGGPRPAASRRLVSRSLSLRHRRQACHSVRVTANTAARLMQHYVDNFRRLPWRAKPGSAAPDPYRVWLSEVMLQQTTVAAVIPRFERFVERWPTIHALAAASDEDVLSEWAGLGYYARARNLIACAREIAGRGCFPTSAGELRQLPGIGDYTAAAVAAIAFGEHVFPVDTNIRRVIARLHAIRQPQRAEIEAL